MRLISLNRISHQCYFVLTPEHGVELVGCVLGYDVV